MIVESRPLITLVLACFLTICGFFLLLVGLALGIGGKLAGLGVLGGFGAVSASLGIWMLFTHIWKVTFHEPSGYMMLKRGVAPFSWLWSQSISREVINNVSVESRESESPVAPRGTKNYYAKITLNSGKVLSLSALRHGDRAYHLAQTIMKFIR